MQQYLFSFAASVLFIATLSGCQTIVSVSHSEMTVRKGQQVSAVDSGLSFLYLNAPALSTNSILAKRCPGGQVTGIETRLLKRDFVVVQVYDLITDASCQGLAPAKTTP